MPRLLQWNCNEVLDVRCTSAEFRSLYYATIYPTEISKVPLGYISAQCRIADTEAYRHKLVSFSIPQSLHYIKKAQGCAEGRGLVPLCGFLTFQCGSTLCGLPQSKRPSGRGLRSPCGYYFPIQNLENISLTRSSPSDSPRIRPRLSYASVRSME